MHRFKGHSFRVPDNEKMEETTESISKYGVLVPGLVRPRTKGGYEIIARTAAEGARMAEKGNTRPAAKTAHTPQAWTFRRLKTLQDKGLWRGINGV